MWRSDSNAFTPLDANALHNVRGKPSASEDRRPLPCTTSPALLASGLRAPYPFEAAAGSSQPLFAANGGLNASSEVPWEDKMAALQDELRQSRRLALRYRHESEGLRQQLKAAAVREELLSGRLEDAYREVARTKAEVNHAQSKQVVTEEMTQLRAMLQSRERELRTLQVRQVDLEGRLRAYEDVWGRDSADVAAPPGAAPPLADVLRECWSDVEYLVKVVNAIHHCQFVRHAQDDDSSVAVGVSGEGAAELTSCVRARDACEARCLQAIVKGNTEGRGEVRRRGHGLDDTAVALSVREALQYCVSTTVRCAARRVSDEAQCHQTLDQHATTTRTRTTTTTTQAPELSVGEKRLEYSGADDEAVATPSPEATPVESAITKDPTTTARDPKVAADELELPQEMPRRRRHVARSHTTAEDCQVQ